MAQHCGSGKRRMAVKLILCILLFLIPMMSSAGRSSFSRRKLEVRNHLKRLNKPALKSIKSPDGDIIDCVHIKNQPAFDHPLLKNHTIQMKPSSYPNGSLFGESKVSSDSEPITHLWHLNGSCPEGTIPIRRTTEDDVLRASTVTSFGRKKPPSFPQPMSNVNDLVGHTGRQHAIVYVKGEKYYGAKANMNVWKPRLQQRNDFSLSQMWILGGPFGYINSIEAGWQVSPHLYGDDRTRLFTYWTSDGYRTKGCYNLLCSGFVQINNRITMGATIYPISGYGGTQYDITILIWKDPKHGNWWMQYGNHYLLGYWPARLFKELADSASMVQWGGEVVNAEPDGEQTSTGMGSGHFPVEGYGRASFFKNIQTIDASNVLRAPRGIATFTEQPNCYNVKTGKNRDWQNYFYYGGPGRNPKCP